MGIVDHEGLERLPTDGGQAPLKPQTVRKWLSIEWGAAKRELVGTTSLLTGLYGSEVSHLAASWVVENDGDVAIHVPHRTRCVVSNDPPCLVCEEHSDGQFTTDRWPREVPVYDDRLAAALSVLSDSEEHLTYRTYYRSLNNIHGRSEISREINSLGLGHTFGVALAAKGVDREQIHYWTGRNPDDDIGSMTYARDYQKLAATSPWDELEVLGTGEFRP